MKEKTMSAIIASTVGGILLLFATIFLNAFLTSPPTRAEFDSFKATTDQRNISIDRRLLDLKTGQNEILKTLLQTRSFKGERDDRQN